MIEIIFFAVIAVAVLWRLYQVLGRKTGAERPNPPVLHPASKGSSPATETQPGSSWVASSYVGPGADGITAIAQADDQFDAEGFIDGAKAAYAMIVKAYGEGDIPTLAPLLTQVVLEAYKAAIADRLEQTGPPAELVRLVSARIVEAELLDGNARITVAFNAELAEGANGLKTTNELWTFERRTGTADPNWRLSAVDAVV